MAVKNEISTSTKRKAAQAVKFSAKKEKNVMLKKVYALLKKTEVDRSDDDKQFLYKYIDLVKEVRGRIERQKTLKDRLKEVEDPPDVISEKCRKLAKALSTCRRLVVYTGAGVSTAACIPDYRGSNGIWTLLQQGKDIGLHDLSKAEPTLTHMALAQLHKVGLIKHVVSQNCDGLHLRSGLPKEALSEVHGNMYIEVCRKCQPVKEYVRLFDVTENTGRFNHRTGRRCYMCSGALIDSIVHFGERGTLKWPLNWPGAVTAAANADAILCIGSSLKVLKRYPWLWGMDKHPKKRPKLYIVNLQWTPKDDQSVLKINARCDFVLEQVMHHLQIGIPNYNRSKDPIFTHATPLSQVEEHTTTKPLLETPEMKSYDSNISLSQEILSVKYPKCQLSSNESDKSLRTKQDGVVEVKDTLCETISLQSLNSNRFKSEEDEFDLPIRKASSIKLESVVSNVVVSKNMDSLQVDLTNQSLKNNDKLMMGKVLNAEDNSYLKNNVNCVLPIKNIDSCKSQDVKLMYECFGENGDSNDSNIPFMEIIYEGVKLKVEENVSVDANVKINNDMLILCDAPSIHCNSFMFNTSYEFEEADNDVKFINLNHKRENHWAKSYKRFGSADNVQDNIDYKNNVGIHIDISKELYTHFDSEVHNCSHFSPVLGSSFYQFKKLKRDSISDEKTAILPDSQKKVSLRKCVCCAAWYGAKKCLFYLPVEPVFKNSSMGVCECCDGSEEEEEDYLEENERKEDRDGSSTSVKPVTNPGWYGKGYRKRFKKKR